MDFLRGLLEPASGHGGLHKQRLDASSLGAVQGGMCLVPPGQRALGGFTYSCRVCAHAKQGLSTFQGGTEEDWPGRLKAKECGPVVEVADLGAVDAGEAAKASSLIHRK